MSSILLVNTRPTRVGPEPELDSRIQSYFDALEARGAKLGDTRTEPNNGLLVIGGVLRDAGHTVKYLDVSSIEYHRFIETGRFFTHEEMYALIEEEAKDYEFVFFSAIVVGIEDCFKAMEHLKRTMPEKHVVLGGTFPSLKPEYCMEQCGGIDVLTVGEGEEISLRVIDALAAGTPEVLESEKGIGLRTEPFGPYIYNEGFNLVDLDKLGRLALPDWSLLDPDLGPHVYRVMTSRGCGFRCSYCVPSHLSGHRVRYHDDDMVMDTIRELKAQGVDNYVIGDLTFFFDPAKSRKLLARIAEEKIDLPFWCQTHMSRVTDENMAALRDAGCAQIAIGIESINASILDNIHKDIDPTEIVDRLLLVKKYGIDTQTYFIIGFPGDDTRTVDMNREFIKYGISSGFIDRTHIGVYVPYPGPSSHDDIDIAEPDYRFYTQGIFRDLPTKAVFNTTALSSYEITEAFADSLYQVGKVIAATPKHEVIPPSADLIHLAIDLLGTVQQLADMRSKGKLAVLNVVQGIRPNKKAFISQNVFAEGDMAVGTMEIYTPEEAEHLLTTVGDKVDLILLDADVKSDTSRALLDTVYATAKIPILEYSDLDCWTRSMGRIIQHGPLSSNGSDLKEQRVLVTPKNILTDHLVGPLQRFGMELTTDNSEEENRFDAVIDLSLNGQGHDADFSTVLKEGGLLLDGAVGGLTPETIDAARAKGIHVFRPDMRTLIAQEVTLGLKYQRFMDAHVGQSFLDDIPIASGGFVAEKGTVIVDSVTVPKQIIGIANGYGRVLEKNELDADQRKTLIKAISILEERG